MTKAHFGVPFLCEKIMIIGLVLRNYKTYSGINYIPLALDKKFCGLLGKNGIGKSSILEALDTLFNYRQWNFNISVKKSGFSTTTPSIIPVFTIPKNEITDLELLELADKISENAWSVMEADVPLAYRGKLGEFIEHRELIKENISKDDVFLLPIGIDYQLQPTLGIFSSDKLLNALNPKFIIGSKDRDEENIAIKNTLPLLNHLKSKFEYIYIPRDMDFESFTQLETKEIQALIGESLIDTLEKRVTPEQIKEINLSLNQYLESLSTNLADYAYRTPTDRQQNLKKSDIYNLIVDAFFNIRKLHKKNGDHWLEIASLSSGEKQRAIIDIAKNLLLNRDEVKNKVIVGIDEPEASLHMSACYDQFTTLHEIAQKCRQLLFSTHWYGFMPIAKSGSVTCIQTKDESHTFNILDLINFREQLKQSASKQNGPIPFDIKIKSTNDFIQSVITSIMNEKPFNWIICEGSTEKLYLEKYFEQRSKENNLRIVPVGGAAEIKKIYKQLEALADDLKSEIKGRIFLLSDTDPQLVKYDVTDFPWMKCHRLVNSKKNTLLVKIQGSPASPKTEIEDSLNGRVALNALLDLKKDFDELNFILDRECGDLPSYYSLNLGPLDEEKLTEFFDGNSGHNKIIFAKKYISLLKDETKVPEWINEIDQFLFPPKEQSSPAKQRRKSK